MIIIIIIVIIIAKDVLSPSKSALVAVESASMAAYYTANIKTRYNIRYADIYAIVIL
jgi:hypothetical protein